MSYNKVILEGLLGKDPEVRITESGIKMATFSLATSKSWKDKSGAKQSKTEWHNCIAWKGTADVIEKYTSKGSNVLVQGELTYSDYTDQSGCKKRNANINIETIVLLGKREHKQDDNTDAEPQKEEPESGKRKPGRPSKAEMGDEEDMPF